MWKRWVKRGVACLALVAFIVSIVAPSYAQTGPQLLAPGTMVALSPAYDPVMLRGIKVDPQAPLNINFILDKGNDNAPQDELSDHAAVVVRDFLAALTVPEDDLWVNLSPYEKDRIIPDAFSLTEMGRSFLEQDYLLKQLTASMLHPDSDLGKRFWSKVYARVYERYGTTDIPLDTFNKVWIAPQAATVYENESAAFVIEAKFKVMVEEDYLALDQHQGIQSVPAGEDDPRKKIGRDVLREIIIPALESEVNEGASFGRLRQIYHALLLALWFKKKLKGSVLDKEYFGRNKVAGISSHDPQFTGQVYQAYLKAFQQGVYNFIREEADPVSGEILPRKYFSGGLSFDDAEKTTVYTRAKDGLLRFAAGGLFVLGMTVAVFSGSAQEQAVVDDVPPVEERVSLTSLVFQGERWKGDIDSVFVARLISDVTGAEDLNTSGIFSVLLGTKWKLVYGVEILDDTSCGSGCYTADEISRLLGYFSRSTKKIVLVKRDTADGVRVALLNSDGKEVVSSFDPGTLVTVLEHEFAHAHNGYVGPDFVEKFEQMMRHKGDVQGLAWLQEAKVFFDIFYGNEENMGLLQLMGPEDPELRRDLLERHKSWDIFLKRKFRNMLAMPLSEVDKEEILRYLRRQEKVNNGFGAEEILAHVYGIMAANTDFEVSAHNKLRYHILAKLLELLQTNPDYVAWAVDFFNAQNAGVGRSVRIDPDRVAKILDALWHDPDGVMYEQFSKGQDVEVERSMGVLRDIADGVDSASKSGSADRAADTGGIDMTAGNMPFKVLGEGQMANFNIKGPVEGLTARITGIMPLLDLGDFLGLSRDVEPSFSAAAT